MEWPKARYGLYQCDTVLLDGEQVGVSHDCGYIYNEKAFVSLASIDTERAPIGSEVTVLWGESPNSSKPAVEPHVQVELRATVAPNPIRVVRTRRVPLRLAPRRWGSARWPAPSLRASERQQQRPDRRGVAM